MGAAADVKSARCLQLASGMLLIVKSTTTPHNPPTHPPTHRSMGVDCDALKKEAAKRVKGSQTEPEQPRKKRAVGGAGSWGLLGVWRVGCGGWGVEGAEGVKGVEGGVWRVLRVQLLAGVLRVWRVWRVSYCGGGWFELTWACVVGWWLGFDDSLHEWQ